MPDKEYKINFGLDSDKNYIDDERQSANLKKSSVDKTGAAKYGKKQNAFGNYVVDLQADLDKLGFKDVGTADGDFGGNTDKAVKQFQMAAWCKLRDDNGKSKELQDITIQSSVDGVVGPKTKSEIKSWKNNNYSNPWQVIYPVDLKKQTHGLSCWAKSMEMVMAYYGKSPTEDQIGSLTGRNDMDKEGGPMEDEMHNVASNMGFGWIDPGNYDFNNWTQFLQGHGPLIVTEGWTMGRDSPQEQEGSHMILVTGASKDYGDVKIILINDPAKDTEYRLDRFEDFLDSLEEYSKLKGWESEDKESAKRNKAYSIYYFKH